jgi:hypothetical protein
MESEISSILTVHRSKGLNSSWNIQSPKVLYFLMLIIIHIEIDKINFDSVVMVLMLRIPFIPYPTFNPLL